MVMSFEVWISVCQDWLRTSSERCVERNNKLVHWLLGDVGLSFAVFFPIIKSTLFLVFSVPFVCFRTCSLRAREAFGNDTKHADTRHENEGFDVWCRFRVYAS